MENDPFDSLEGRPPNRKRRLRGLLAIMLVLMIYHLVGSVYRPIPKKDTPWLTRETFDQFIEGQTIVLPAGRDATSGGAETLTLHWERVESLRIEPNGQVSFIVRTDKGRYAVQGFVDRGYSDGWERLTVNLGEGWWVAKE